MVDKKVSEKMSKVIAKLGETISDFQNQLDVEELCGGGGGGGGDESEDGEQEDDDRENDNGHEADDESDD